MRLRFTDTVAGPHTHHDCNRTLNAIAQPRYVYRDPETGAYDLDRIRRGKPDEYTDDEWEKYINFWNDPANVQRAETNRLNRSKSTVVSRHGSRSIPLTRHLMKMTSATQEEPSEIDTFYRLHTVNGVFQDPEALRMYWHQFLDQKIRGAHFSLRIVAGERFAIELTPSTFPQRHFAGDMFPQRHVTGEKVGMLLGKASNVV
ncbi:F-box domain containing protein, partial [Tanacetum coccineum]